MTAKLGELNDRSKTIVESIRLRLNERQALTYLKEAGFEMSARTYYREKRKIESLKLKRLYHIAQIGFQDQHLERIDNYETGFKIMWQNVRLEKDPYKCNQMIKDILLLQPYLSAYYEATKLIIIGVDKQQQQSEYQEFLDNKQLQNEQEKNIESQQQQQNEDSRNNCDDEE